MLLGSREAGARWKEDTFRLTIGPNNLGLDQGSVWCRCPPLVAHPRGMCEGLSVAKDTKSKPTKSSSAKPAAKPAPKGAAKVGKSAPTKPEKGVMGKTAKVIASKSSSKVTSAPAKAVKSEPAAVKKDNKTRATPAKTAKVTTAKQEPEKTTKVKPVVGVSTKEVKKPEPKPAAKVSDDLPELPEVKVVTKSSDALNKAPKAAKAEAAVKGNEPKVKSGKQEAKSDVKPELKSEAKPEVKSTPKTESKPPVKTGGKIKEIILGDDDEEEDDLGGADELEEVLASEDGGLDSDDDDDSDEEGGGGKKGPSLTQAPAGTIGPKPAGSAPAAKTPAPNQPPRPIKRPKAAPSVTQMPPGMGRLLDSSNPIRKPLIPSGPSAVPQRPLGVQSGSVGPATKIEGKSPFNKRELERFRAILVRKRAELVGDVANIEDGALRGQSGGSSGSPNHMAEQGSENYEQSLSLDIAAADRRLIREVDDALDRIERGTFGLCEVTGRPIKVERLDEIPWTRLSIEAAIEQERQSMRQ